MTTKTTKKRPKGDVEATLLITEEGVEQVAGSLFPESVFPPPDRQTVWACSTKAATYVSEERYTNGNGPQRYLTSLILADDGRGEFRGGDFAHARFVEGMIGDCYNRIAGRYLTRDIRDVAVTMVTYPGQHPADQQTKELGACTYLTVTVTATIPYGCLENEGWVKDFGKMETHDHDPA